MRNSDSAGTHLRMHRARVWSLLVALHERGLQVVWSGRSSPRANGRGCLVNRGVRLSRTLAELRLVVAQEK